jgi:hypothetical protein
LNRSSRDPDDRGSLDPSPSASYSGRVRRHLRPHRMWSK